MFQIQVYVHERVRMCVYVMCVCACVSDLSHVGQFLQGCGGRGRGGVALLDQVREVTVVTVIPKPVALSVAASPPLLRLR